MISVHHLVTSASHGGRPLGLSLAAILSLFGQIVRRRAEEGNNPITSSVGLLRTEEGFDQPGKGGNRLWEGSTLLGEAATTPNVT